ncbi:MAG: Fic family protein [Vulcanimicrobiota bacterium]
MARSEVSRFDGLLNALANPALLLAPITSKEAVLSSKIEGTVTTLEEVLKQDAGFDYPGEKHQDLQEVQNYRRVIFQIVEHFAAEQSLSLSIVKQMHHILMQGVRGQNKTPGEFRNLQNWIGKAGCKIEDARFVPPSPTVLPGALLNFEEYLRSRETDPMLQVAIAHAQFEILHPFLDGNGRVGRLLIPTVMFQRNLLFRPVFYLSEVLEGRRSEYYDRLLAVTRDGDWLGWIRFFCNAVVDQANINTGRIRKILSLYNDIKSKLRDFTSSKHGIAAIDTFFARPITNSVTFAAHTKIDNRVTTNKLLAEFEKAGIITCLRRGTGRTPSIYGLLSLLEIIDSQ